MKYLKYFEKIQEHKKYLVQDIYNALSSTSLIVYENIKELPENKLMLKEVYRMTKDGVLTPKYHQPTFTYNIGDVDWVYQSNNLDDVVTMLKTISNNNKFNL